jgi:IS5 family transposase
MRLYNELQLRFDSPFWALYPEFALFDVILEKKPELIKLVSKDVLAGIKESVFGRKDSPTVEQILRAAVYKEVKQLNYRELEKDMYDSKICALFLKLDNDQAFSYSVMQKYISKISEPSLRAIIVEINRIAIAERIETIEKVSTDTTTVETDIHHPTNNSLVYDCIKTATQILKKSRENDKEAQHKLDRLQQEAKKYNFQINNTKKESMPSLFAPYLDILKTVISEVWHTIRNTKEINYILSLKSFLPKMIKVYRIAKSLQIQGVQVKNDDKIFSVYETHTDILVKGNRNVEFGHKVLFTRGVSNIILDYKTFLKNPGDMNLLIPSIDTIINNYGISPKSTSNDGGFCSNKNLKACQSRGIVNIVFTKVTQSLKNVVTDQSIEKELKKWRGTTEAVISNIKRGFGLNRVTWEGFDKFCAKVAWSVLGYNLRVMVNRMLK